MQNYKKFNRRLGEEIKKGAVGVLPTDTIYGIVGSAFFVPAVRRIYGLRKRNPKKPFIVLISSVGDLKLFGVRLSGRIKDVLKKVWPGKVSILLSTPGKNLAYLHRGTKKIAFRLPAKKGLRDLILVSGPVVAPSANWEGKPPARNIREARRYFGDRVDFYLDNGTLESPPSTLVSVENGRFRVLRPGAGKIAKSVAL